MDTYLFDSNTIALEEFMDYSAMMIAEEGFFSKALASIQRMFAKLVLFIDKKVKSMKDNKLKRVLQGLLNRAKRGLAKCKSLKKEDPEMIKQLQEEYQEIKEEVEDVDKKNSNGNGDEEIHYRDDGKTIWYIEYPDGKVVTYYGDGKTIWYIEYPDGKTEYYQKDGKTIWYIEYPDGKRVTYDENGKEIKD